MKLKYQIDLPLDSPERTVHHGELIRSKKFLSELYHQWNAEYVSEITFAPEGFLVELGSGGGALKEMEERIITSDFAYGFVNFWDRILPRISKELSMFMLVKITRCASSHNP